MLLGIAWPSKQPGETWIVEADFAADLDAASYEGITSATVTSRERNTGLDSTASFLSGAPEVVGSKVRVRTVAGAAGETHRLQYTIHTSASNIIQHEIDVPVEDYAR